MPVGVDRALEGRRGAAPPSRRSRRRPALLLLAVGVLAFLVRLRLMVAGGGLGGLTGYDDGVYFAASTALVHGLMPYRDFLLLHPPGLMLALAPFAWFGRLTHDSWGFESARLAWMAIGALNAVLVALIARRWGWLASLAGGVFYALWTPVALTEVTTRLEPVGSLALLVALLVLARRPFPVDGKSLVVVGLALGLSMSVKIWGLAPALYVVAWCGARLGLRAAAKVCAGVLAAVTVICLPFFLVAHWAMVRMVVSDQLSRGQTSSTMVDRLQSMGGLTSRAVGPAGAPLHWAALLVVLGLVVVAAVAGGSDGRFVVGLLALTSVVLLASPSYFSHYAAFMSPALALSVACGVGAVGTALARRRRGSGRARLRVLGVVVAAGSTLSLLATDAGAAIGQPFPAAQVRGLSLSARCVTADSPDVLLLSDVFSRDIERGCPVSVDLTGLTYDRDALPLLPNGKGVDRALNPGWQRDLMRYLLSGQVIILTRASSDRFSPDSLRQLDRLVVATAGRGYLVLTQ